MLVCVGVQIYAVSQAQLAVDRCQMVAQRVLADVQFLGHQLARG